MRKGLLVNLSLIHISDPSKGKRDGKRRGEDSAMNDSTITRRSFLQASAAAGRFVRRALHRLIGERPRRLVQQGRGPRRQGEPRSRRSLQEASPSDGRIVHRAVLSSSLAISLAF